MSILSITPFTNAIIVTRSHAIASAPELANHNPLIYRMYSSHQAQARILISVTEETGAPCLFPGILLA
jgi:hypothetical protein